MNGSSGDPCLYLIFSSWEIFDRNLLQNPCLKHPKKNSTNGPKKPYLLSVNEQRLFLITMWNVLFAII